MTAADRLAAIRARLEQNNPTAAVPRLYNRIAHEDIAYLLGEVERWRRTADSREKEWETLTYGAECACCYRNGVITYFDGEARICVNWRGCKAQQEILGVPQTVIAEEQAE